MVCYAFCRRRPVHEGNGDGAGQCKFGGEKKYFVNFFFVSARWHCGLSMAFWFRTRESVAILALLLVLYFVRPFLP